MVILSKPLTNHYSDIPPGSNVTSPEGSLPLDT